MIADLLQRLHFGRLSRREKVALAGGALLLAAWLAVELGVAPLFERRARLRQAVAAKTAQLAEMEGMKAEVEGIRGRARRAEQRFERRDKGFTLFGFLDQLAGQTQVKDRVTTMRPSKIEQKNSPLKLSRVEMKLEGVTLEQLTRFLVGVETSRNEAVVSKLSVSRREKTDGLLDAVLQVETLEP